MLSLDDSIDDILFNSKAFKSPILKLFAIAGAMAILIAPVAGFDIDTGYRSNTAYILWKISLPHKVCNVNVVVYVDDVIVAVYEDVVPNSDISSETYYEYHFPASETSKTIEVRAVSDGNSLGLQTDHELITMSPGGAYTVNLHA